MNVLCFLDVDEFKQNVFGIWMSFCMCLSSTTTSMSQTNCMFYFWKLPHVFVMSFDVLEFLQQVQMELEMDVTSLR